MFTWIWIFGIVLALAAQASVRAAIVQLTCEEFERGAHFDPYEAIDSLWKIFYFWADTTEVYPIVFALPVRERVQRMRSIVEAIDPDMGVEWHRATLFMTPRPGVLILFLYAGTPGAFRAIITKERRDSVRPYREPLIKLADVRMKIEDRFMGMMCCEDQTAYALVRMDEMPVTELQCEKAAASLGFKGPGGRSYLFIQNLTKQVKDEL